MMMRIAILGSTGSIGDSTLKVVERYPDLFQVVALTAYHRVDLLLDQIQRYQPRYAAACGDALKTLKEKCPYSGCKVLNAEHELSDLVANDEIDCVVIGMRGSAALEPFLSAVRAGKRVAPANKEALVVAGELIMSEARANGATVVPVDSEQSAIFQCLEGRSLDQLRCVHLTASGGSLKNVCPSTFDDLTVEDVLAHPRWRMGPKITVDSATLMNKGFEIIEAQRLFDLSPEQIRVVIHPEAIIHSMAEFNDGSVIAQLAVTDMQLPIQYALTYPQRLETGLEPLDFVKLGSLTFESPDLKKFPALALCQDVARQGGTLPAVLNAADEVVVEAFLNKKIRFSEIFSLVEKVVANHQNRNNPDLAEILAADEWAREEARRAMGSWT